MTASRETIETDVVICGSGSAGICAAVWLAQAGVHFRLLEQRPGPLKVGQADGVQCRTVEIFESFGISEELLREANHITELTFWSEMPDTGRLNRTSRAPDTPRGLSHQPHVVLNQAKVNQILLDKMLFFAPNQNVDYNYTVTGVGETGDSEFPLYVLVTNNGKQMSFKAKYILACDGAHSTVRHSLGIEMVGDTTEAVWGVMDVFPRTDFPDIRRKVTIQTNRGALLLIPREGGQLVRFYLQLPPGTDPKEVTLDLLQSRALVILKDFDLEFIETIWWSAYTIGQRLASTFSAANDHIFLAGDACHTHSPKAGQGMNVSLQDGYNIGWKMAQVLCRRASPEILSTYVSERHKVAADLISFDRNLTDLYRKPASRDSAQRFKEHFLMSASYMAGLTSKYEDTILTRSASSNQSLAKNILVGARCPSAKVVRFCDAQVVEFQKALVSDLRWRILVFVGDLQSLDGQQNLDKITEFLESAAHPIRGDTSKGMDIDSFVEVLLIIARGRAAVELENIPKIFRPEIGNRKIAGRIQRFLGDGLLLTCLDLYKIYVDDEGYDGTFGRAYQAFGISVEDGAVVVVRPDQYVSLVTGFDKLEEVGNLFESFTIEHVPV